ncbi:lck-interacting transmembrane adapter 1 isoform X3 [Pongo pygmaeus]|nr:lck-interacting transmembrane adapter 1 isoform X3 [Pongo pygmaeus]
MSGQRVAAGGVCGLWRTPRDSPDAGYYLGYGGHSCPAPPHGHAGRYHGHPQGHRGARQSSPSSPHREPPPEGPRLHRMGLPVSWAPPAFWVLGCCALLLWLWALCTACRRPEDAVAPRKRTRRQRARLQGSATAAEAQVGHQTARAAPGPARQQGPAACQHGSPAPTLAGGVQGHHRTAGRPLCLPTPGAAPGSAGSCSHRRVRWPRGHLFQRGAGGPSRGQPGGQPCGG